MSATICWCLALAACVIMGLLIVGMFADAYRDEPWHRRDDDKDRWRF